MFVQCKDAARLTPLTDAAAGTTASAPALRVHLQDVEHRFGLRQVFQGVNMTVQPGEVGIIMGANGAGKSTLLKIVAGLLPPTSGTANVQANGRNLDAMQRRRMLGYVAPDLMLYRELTGVENLEFFARLRGITLRRDDLRAMLERVGLKGRGRDLVGAYSSGMRQRLKYAFALLSKPPLLLLDEPTANLDADGVGMVEQIIDEWRSDAQRLVIVATNEPREEQWGTVQVRLN